MHGWPPAPLTRLGKANSITSAVSGKVLTTRPSSSWVVSTEPLARFSLNGKLRRPRVTGARVLPLLLPVAATYSSFTVIGTFCPVAVLVTPLIAMGAQTCFNLAQYQSFPIGTVDPNNAQNFIDSSKGFFISMQSQNVQWRDQQDPSKLVAALAGAYLACAQKGMVALVDGYICSVAALCAVRLNPACRDWLLFAHSGAEPGHRHVLEALAAQPLLDLGLRLGEGSGAALAVPLLRQACALHAGMATFAEAAVSDRPA